jgi:hypothetical protein
MVYSEAQTYLETLVKDRWYSDTPAVDLPGPIPLKAPIQFENARFPINADTLDYLYKLQIDFVGHANIGLGALCQRVSGILKMSLFFRPETGLAVPMRAAEDLSSFFTNQVLSKYEFLESTIRKLPIDNLGWVQLVVTSPFTFDNWS